MSKNVVLSVSHLTKEFDVAPKNFRERFFAAKKKFKAVDNISFKVYEGEILGLLGPNGAGKTTTIHMLLGIMTPNSGTINVFGMEFNKHRSEILKDVNFSSAYVNLPWRLTVAENLRVFGGLYEVPDLEKRIDELLELFEAGDLKNKKISHLSAGQRTRVVLVKALLNRPKLLFLDEPTVSLDPDLADKTRKYIVDLQQKEGIAVLFTSHNMSEVEEICDRVIFLNKGQIIAEDTPQGLARRSKKTLIRLLVLDGLKRTQKYAMLSGLKHAIQQRSIIIEIEEQEIASFLQRLAGEGITYSDISIDKPSLEDFFLEVARGRNYEH